MEERERRGGVGGRRGRGGEGQEGGQGEEGRGKREDREIRDRQWAGGGMQTHESSVCSCLHERFKASNLAYKGGQKRRLP